MPRTPGVDITNVIEAGSPTVNDDITKALDVGSRWTNSSTEAIFFCANNAPGAAVWRDVSTPGAGSHPVHVAAVSPTPTDDSVAGFAVGDHWINTANTRIYQAVSVAVGAADWDRVDNETGSGPGAAVNPGELMFGTLLDYPSAGNVTASEIQYIRIRISQGVVLASMRTFIDSGGTGSRDIRMAIYAQTDPLAEDGEPATRVAQTEAVATNGANGSFITEAFLTGDYTIPTTGFYWLAIITDSTSIKFAVSATHRANFLAARHESGSGTTLPATVGTISNPVSAVIYVAGVEA